MGHGLEDLKQGSQRQSQGIEKGEFRRCVFWLSVLRGGVFGRGYQEKYVEFRSVDTRNRQDDQSAFTSRWAHLLTGVGW